MNKWYVMLLAGLLTANSSFALSTINWGSADPLLDESSNPVPDGWVVQLYQNSDLTIDFTYGVSTPIISDAINGGDGTFLLSYQSATTPAITPIAQNNYLYTVIWNGDNSKYCVVDSTPFTTVNGVNEDYVVPQNNPANWTPVPEPGTMAMFGIGAVILALRKKMRK